MQGFVSSGCRVFPYIVGDRMPLGWVASPGNPLASNSCKRLGADFLRIAANGWHSRKAYRKLRQDAEWAYERFGSFQSLGKPFQRDGIPWILETNAPLALENKLEPGRRLVYWQRAAEHHELRTYRGCDALVVQTAVLKEILLQWASIDPHKVFVVPNAVDAKRFSHRQALRKFAGPTIGFAGALRRWQALDKLLFAIRDLRREGIDYNLVIIGDGEKRREWQSLAGELGLAERVFFAGSVPLHEVPEWLAGVDLGFSGQCGQVASQPAYFSPLKLYEYMAAAKPVLASGLEDAARLIAPGETGYFFAVDSQPDLERALRRAWRERDSWPAMGARGRAVILAEHTWEVRVRRMVIQLQEFFAGRGTHAQR